MNKKNELHEKLTDNRIINANYLYKKLARSTKKTLASAFLQDWVYKIKFKEVEGIV